MSISRKDEIRAQIKQLTSEYYKEAYSARSFTPGESPVPVSGRVFDDSDMFSIVDSGTRFWLTAGRFADLFESSLRSCRSTRRAAGKFWFFGKLGGSFCADISDARRATAQAG